MGRALQIQWYYIYEDFLQMPSHITLAIVMLLVALHLFLSFVIMRPLYRKSRDGIMRQIMRGIYTFVHPPLFCDWEEFYRGSDFNLSVLESWNKSKKVFAIFQLLFLVEHSLLLLNIVWLKICIKKDQLSCKKVHSRNCLMNYYQPTMQTSY